MLQKILLLIFNLLQILTDGYNKTEVELGNVFMLIKELNLREESRSVLRESNLERLKIALSYFSYLKRQGIIEEETFEVLVKYACSLFIENEVEEKVESVLERKLMQFFDSRLSHAI